MPFSGNQCPVASTSQHFPEGGPVLHVVVADGVGGVSGQQLGPGCVAFSSVVKLLKPQATFGQHVQIGRLHFPTIATDVGVAHVIHHDQDDVGLCAIRCCVDQGDAE